jgi:hypothetical protein
MYSVTIIIESKQQADLKVEESSRRGWMQQRLAP